MLFFSINTNYYLSSTGSSIWIFVLFSFAD